MAKDLQFSRLGICEYRGTNGHSYVGVLGQGGAVSKEMAGTAQRDWDDRSARLDRRSKCAQLKRAYAGVGRKRAFSENKDRFAAEQCLFHLLSLT